MMRDSLKATSIVALSLVILAGGFLTLRATQESYEYGDDLCLANRPLVAHAVLIVDKTDAMTPSQQAYLLQVVQDLKRELADFERFSIYAISNRHEQLPQPLISLCNPGTAKSANILVRTPSKVQAEFDERFDKPVRAVIESLDRTDEARLSPIVETIRTITLMGSFGSSIESRRLVIFSDMIQNTHYSHFDVAPNFDDYFLNPKYRNMRPDLDGVDVSILYITRKEYARVQSPQHIDFWRRFFDEAGANVRIELVAG